LTERLTYLEQHVGEMLPKASMPGLFPGMMPGMAGMSPMMAQMGQQADQPSQKRNAKKDSEPPTEEEVRNRFLQAARAGLANKSGDAASTNFNAEAPVFVPRGASSQADETAGTAPAKAAAASITSTTADATKRSTTEPTDFAKAVNTGDHDIGDDNTGGDIAPGGGEGIESTSGTLQAAVELVVPPVPSEAPPPPPGISLVATEASAGEAGTLQTDNTEAAEITL